jgi:hypothetical protein
MKHLLWIIPLILGMAAIQWPRLMAVALIAMLVCGVGWILSLVVGTRGSSLARPVDENRSEQNRDVYDVQRNIPPPS